MRVSLFVAPLVLCAGVGLALSGCGGSNNGNKEGTRTPTASPVATTFLTRSTEGTVSEDAKILATRVATGAFVSLDAARAFDADLSRIRAQYPAVSTVHARADFTGTDLLVTVKPSAKFLSKWQASASQPDATVSTDLATGESKLDALLTKYDATRTADTADFDEDGIYFVLRFGQSLNMAVVAEEFAKSSGTLVNVAANGSIGDGDNLVFTKGSDGAKVYTFTQGYGDCPAGCINHYTHKYTLAADGSITETVTGQAPATGDGGYDGSGGTTAN